MNNITGRRRKRPSGPRIQVFLMENPKDRFRVTNASHKLGIDPEERFPGGAGLNQRIAIKVAAVLGCEPQDLEIYDRVADCNKDGFRDIELIFTGEAVDKYIGNAASSSEV